MNGGTAVSASRYRLLPSSAVCNALLAVVFFVSLYTLFFMPAIAGRRVLAPGDGMFYYMPHYSLPFSLWNPGSMTGYPEMADPQAMRWYLPALLLSRIPGTWNAFVIAAYVLASWFTYLYVQALTSRHFAGLVAGVIFGTCGFMTAHLGHASIIHAAAWIPAMLWCCEKMASDSRFRWAPLLGIAASQCILAGHPQIALYGLSLTVAYAALRAVFMASRRLPCSLSCLSGLVLALMMSAVQTLNTLTLSSLTPRARLSFTEFSNYALHPYQVVSVLFPSLFGGGGALYFDNIPYFGPWNLTELAGYAGFGALALAAAALLSSQRLYIVAFWIFSGLFALVAATGAATPLAKLLYALPAFGQFRAPGRFLVLYCLAAAVLAGCGIAAIAENKNGRRAITATLATFAALAAAGGTITWLFAPLLKLAATAGGIPSLPLSLFLRNWVGVPVAIGLVLTVLLILFIRAPRSLLLRGALLMVFIVEMGSFGWYAEWRYGSPTSSEFQPPPAVLRLAEEARRTNSRWLSVKGPEGGLAQAPPDLSLLWNVPLVAKYGPLLPSRYKDLLSMETNGYFTGEWWNPANRAIDIAGAGFVALETEMPGVAGTVQFHGVTFPAEDVNIIVGRGCGATTGSQTIKLDRPKRAVEIGTVTLLGCSVGFAQGTPVAEIRLNGANGASRTFNLRAGIETAEWAAACEDVVRDLQHKPAPVYSRFPVPRGGGTCQAQRYGAVVELRGEAIDVESLDFRWVAPGEGVIRLNKLVFVDREGQKMESLSGTETRLGRWRWKEVDRSGGTVVYRNLRAMPRAWIASETISLSADEVKQSIQTSRMPGGREYDPATMALIEEPLDFRLENPDPQAKAWVVEDHKTSVEVRTSSSQQGFLVLADLYYPGWRAFINGHPAKIFQTNYVQRGVFVPPGLNHVRFEFRPAGFYAGAAISLAALTLIAFGIWRAKVHGRL